MILGRGGWQWQEWKKWGKSVTCQNEMGIKRLAKWAKGEKGKLDEEVEVRGKCRLSGTRARKDCHEQN